MLGKKTCMGLALWGLAAGMLHAAVINVSGGGAALQTAITNATDGDEIVVTDSLDYSPVILTKNLIVRADTGQNPRVVSDINVNNGTAVTVADAGRKGTWDGIDAVQTIVGGGGGHCVFLTQQNTDDATFTLRNTTVEITSGGSMDGKAAGFGDRTLVQNCIFRRNDNNPNPIVQLFDKANFTTFDNCSFGPAVDSHGITNTARANGVTTITNCTFNFPTGARGITIADRPQTVNIDQSTFTEGTFAIFVGNGSSAPGTVFNITRTFFGPKNNDWMIFAGDGSGAVLNLTNNVFMTNTRGAIIYLGNKNHTVNVNHCTFATKAGAAGTNNIQWFLLEGDNTGGSSTFSIRNSLFSRPNSPLSVVNSNPLDPVINAPTITMGTNLFSYGSVGDGDLAINAGGNPIQATPAFLADGYHLAPASQGINAAVPGSVVVDFDGDSRPNPVGSNPDLGADEIDASGILNSVRYWTIY